MIEARTRRLLVARAEPLLDEGTEGGPIRGHHLLCMLDGRLELRRQLRRRRQTVQEKIV